MSITDELRKWAKEHLSRSSILAIADRIDAEHERVRAESILDMTDERMAEHGWVRLPKDADGEYIHIGDVLTDDAEFKSEGVVECLMLDESGWFVGFGKGWTDARIHEWHHYHAPTVEDVLREFALKAAGRECMTLRSDLVDEYASKLQLREDA